MGCSTSKNPKKTQPATSPTNGSTKIEVKPAGVPSAGNSAPSGSAGESDPSGSAGKTDPSGGTGVDAVIVHATVVTDPDDEAAAALVEAEPPLRYPSTTGTFKPQSDYTAKQEEAAKKISAAARGGAARQRVNDVYGRERRPMKEKAVDPRELGLSRYAEFHDSMPRVEDDLRFRVRDATLKSVLEQLACEESLSNALLFPDVACRLLSKVRNDVGILPAGPKMQLQKVTLFIDEVPVDNDIGNNKKEGNEKTGWMEKRKDQYLLGKFDCLGIPARADYNAAFHPIAPAVATSANNAAGRSSPSSAEAGTASSADCDGEDGFKGWFWVLHSAAPNVGESATADDFIAYSRVEDNPNEVIDNNAKNGPQGCWKAKTERTTRRLHEDLYIGDMARLWRNALQSMGKLQVVDGIFFPFGMGAFLRNLHQNDDRYNDPLAMRRLKRRIADEFTKAVVDICIRKVPAATSSSLTVDSIGKQAKQPVGPSKIHLCLLCVNPESIENHNVFVEALGEISKTCPGLKEVVQIRRNVDSLQLAHTLSMASKDSMKVCILNGANRKLCGNHWFQGGARFAIDENLHRRSASMGRAALLLNFDTEPRPRRLTQLADTVRFFQGQVYTHSGDLVEGRGRAPTAFSNSPDQPQVDTRTAASATSTSSADAKAASASSADAKGAKLIRFLPKNVDKKLVLVHEGGNKWRVDNTQLKSGSVEMAYLMSKDMKDADAGLGVKFGSTIQGTDLGEFVQVEIEAEAGNAEQQDSSAASSNGKAKPKAAAKGGALCGCCAKRRKEPQDPAKPVKPQAKASAAT